MINLPKKNLSLEFIYKKRPKIYVLESDENTWVTTKNSSCRYAFITMFALSINQIYNPFKNQHINFLKEIITKILKEKNENYKFDYWKKIV